MQDAPAGPDFTLVIACYNEAPILERSVAETFEVLDTLRLSSEVIFVDDFSKDATREIIDRIIAAHPARALTVIKHPQNVGRGGTVADGIRAARGRLVGYLDIDLEVHARYIPPCLQALDEGYDVATALRMYKFYWRSLDRYVMSKGYRWLMRRVLRLPLRDTETGFKFFRRDRILPVLDATQDRGWFWDTEIMARAHLAGLRIIEIPAVFVRRFDKVSTLNPMADTIDYLKKLWRFRGVLNALRRHTA
jgi:glycosyltransferase involved in cell wall biosynthesis